MMAADTEKRLRNQVMYSIYVRNYSEEGTFRAVERDVERIRNLGVDIIWLLPIHPIGVKNRKGSLGSPYAISDYRKINPELGTPEDFLSLVDTIHRNQMKCIIDVVYNHTAPDSWLAVNHPEYFYHTPDGQMGNRVGDWGDIVDLDYGNRELWAYQIETLRQWAAVVDGFRCDVASLVPLEFWKEARSAAAEVNPDCLWLSESVEPEFLLELREKKMTCLSDSEIFQAFDVSYEYDIFREFRDCLTGSGTLDRYAGQVNRQEYSYPDNYVKLRFLENHDQDRAAALIAGEEKLKNWTAFCFFQKGMTLVYAGQEFAKTRRPSLFDKDVVNWRTGRDLSDLIRRLSEIKKNPVFTDSSYRLHALEKEGVLMGSHRSENGILTGIFRVKGGPGEIVKTDLAPGTYRELLSGDYIEIPDGRVDTNLCPLILEKC